VIESKKIDFDYIEFLQPEEQKKVEADIDKQKLAKIDNAADAKNYKENPFRTFPRIFKSDGNFIGGYNDTRLYFEKN
jgi:glutaredoxin